MNSDELRIEVLQFLEKFGMKKGIVAKETGLSSSILSSWFSGRVNLNAGELSIVQNYLKEKKQKFN
ncbi:MAG: hypothetical protein IJA10_12655 [Lachnospiraceae bacterium]|nr:hypothetical protein [Lachnospiraceae bacterium]